MLTVTLLRGESLLACDSNGSFTKLKTAVYYSTGLSDPFCTFQLGSSKWKSPIVFKSLNPYWNESTKFIYTDGALARSARSINHRISGQNACLMLTVEDKDLFAHNYTEYLCDVFANGRIDCTFAA